MPISRAKHRLILEILLYEPQGVGADDRQTDVDDKGVEQLVVLDLQGERTSGPPQQSVIAGKIRGKVEEIVHEEEQVDKQDEKRAQTENPTPSIKKKIGEAQINIQHKIKTTSTRTIVVDAAEGNKEGEGEGVGANETVVVEEEVEKVAHVENREGDAEKCST